MPRHKSARTLKEICLLQIARKFDYWAKGYVEEYVSQGDVPLYIVGPFDEWTSELTQELLDVLVEHKLAKSYHLHLLLHLRLESLDLSGWSQIVQDNIVNIIAHRCNKIRSLVLRNCKRIKPQTLADVIRALPKLLKLDLSGTRVTDQVLAVLGCSCPHLVDLSLKGTAISDGGLACLNENPANGSPGCKMLRKLDLSCIPLKGNCKSWGRVLVGRPSVLSYAGLASLVSYCDRLEVLDCEDTYGVMTLLNIMPYPECARNSIAIRQLRLCIHEGEDIIGTVPSFFPALIDLSVEGFYWYKELTHLSELKMLKKLSLHSEMRTLIDEGLVDNDDEKVTMFFERGVSPLLQTVGHQLTTLSLHYIPYVDLVAVGEFCANLRHLSLEFYDSLLMTECIRVPSIFSSLKSFECINSNHETTMSASSIKTLCSLLSLATNLEKLHLVCLLGLDDEHFRTVFEHNQLKKLKSASFINCNDITPKTVDYFVHSENDLQKLSVINCRNIWTCNSWIKFCRMDNRALEIDFTEPPYTF